MANHNYSKSPVNGYFNKKYEEAIARLTDLRAERKALNKEWIALGDEYDKTHSAVILAKRSDISDKMGVIEDTIKDLEIQVEADVISLDASYNEEVYTPSEIGFSLGDLNGRTFIGRKHDRLPLDNYEEVATASEFDPDNDNETNLEDLLTMFKVTEDASIMFDSNIAYGLSIKSDDPKTSAQAINHGHAVMMINAENKKACEVLRSAKDPVSMDAENLQDVINESLSAKGKSKAVILVNHSAFAKIDTVDTNGGYPLVKRDAEGRFIYRDKYPIQEIPDEILPNNDNGSSPVIIGDLSIVRFLVMRDDVLERDDFLKVNDRNLKREIIALSTISDKAYIHGSI